MPEMSIIYRLYHFIRVFLFLFLHQKDGLTALMIASMEGHLDIVQILLLGGANRHVVCNVEFFYKSFVYHFIALQHGMSALDWAESAGQTETRLMLQNWDASQSMVTVSIQAAVWSDALVTVSLGCRGIHQ